jgi:DNA invertase Pin-like site-specific DNA recombinase
MFLIDWFTREGVLETLIHPDRLTAARVGYRSFTEPFDSCGILKDAAISILAMIAKLERIRLNERVQAGPARDRCENYYHELPEAA